MSSRTDSLQVAATPQQVRHVILGIASNGDWDVREKNGEFRFVERRQPSIWQTTWKAKVNVTFQPARGGCDIRLGGHIAGMGPLQVRHLRSRMGVLRAALEHQLSAPRPAPPSVPASSAPPKFDTATGRPILGYETHTGEPILGEPETPRATPQAAPGPAADPAAEIHRLQGLLDQNLITQEEFDAKRKEVLGL